MTSLLEILGSNDPMVKSVLEFHAFSKRNKLANDYVDEWASAYLSGSNIDVVKQHAKHIGLVEVSMRAGHWNKTMLLTLTKKLRNRLVEAETEHASFVKGFEKHFKLSVERYDAISNGVALFLDPENTAILQDRLKSGCDFEEVMENLDYTCVRRGQVNDINFGPFSEKLSKWLFIHSPKVDVTTKKFRSSVLKSGKSQKLSPLKPSDF